MSLRTLSRYQRRIPDRQIGGVVLLSESLGDGLRARRRRREGLPTNFESWALKVPEPKFGTLNFDLFPPQRELYSDAVTEAREVVVMKSTQVGVSTWGLRTALHAADDRGDTALYVFPTQTHVSDFSAERVGPAIRASEYLLSKIPPDAVDQVKLKRVGNGWVHFRGSESRAGAQSVAADFIVYDEYDELSPANLEQIERRTSGAAQVGRVPRTRRVGIPRFEGFGIHGRYERSDQRQWHVECANCGEDQVPDFWRNVRWRCEGDTDDAPARRANGKGAAADDPRLDVERAWRACYECEQPLDVATGAWVAKHPGRRVIGFHLTRLCIPLTDVEEIVRNSRKRAAYELEAFYNNDLGIPYEPEEGRLSLQAIRAAQRAYEMVEGKPVDGYARTMGVDVASRRNLSIRISEHFAPGKRRALWIGEVEDFEALDDLMERYQPNMVAIDHLPEYREAQKFRGRWPGRVYIVSYDTTDSPKGTNAGKIFTANYEDRTATVRRTEALDTVLESVRAQRNELPEHLPAGYEDQMRAVVRKREKDEKGRERVFYESKGPDDYAHAEVYDTAAHQLYLFDVEIRALLAPESRPIDELVEVQRQNLQDDDQPYRAGPEDYNEFGPNLDDTDDDDGMDIYR